MTDKYNDFFTQARWFAKWYGGCFVIDYIRKNCREEALELIKRANELKNQKFRFVDRWDMEPCNELYEFTGMTWDVSPNRDPEWVYMLNRHDWLYKLFLAFRLTGDESYVEKLKWYLFHWVEHNPITEEGTETTRTIDTGIRCMNWQFLLLQLAGNDLLQEKELDILLGSIKEQYISMRNRYIGKYTLSNWGVLQTTAICMGYLLFEDHLPGNGMKQWAWKELQRQLELQVFDDGAHWEQSAMYHVEVLLCCLKLLSICNCLGLQVSWLAEKAEAMGRYLMFAAGPDHMQNAQCDSDVTDIRDIMVKAAVLTENEEFKFSGYEKMDLESAWLLGKAGILYYESMYEKRPAQLSLNESDSGNIYFRNHWSEGANYTYLSCGTVGSGHGHADLTHISMYYNGKPFLVDSGRYSYREEEDLRIQLKSAQAHNVCVVDDISMGIPNGSWSFHSYPNAMKNYYREKQGIHFAEMAYQMMLNDQKHCTVIRRVMAADAGIWMIVNDVYCDGEHQIKEYYHLDAEVLAERLQGEPARWKLSHGAEDLFLSGNADFQKEPCFISYRYNELSDSRCLVKEEQFTNRLLNWTLFAGKGVVVNDVPVYQSGSSEGVDSNVVVAKEFVLSENESLTFLIWNQETFRGAKMYVCKEIPVYAKAAAIYERNGNKTLVRLKN